MYVLVQLVEHGVKLRIARRRAAARRGVRPSLLDVGASQLRTPRRAARHQHPLKSRKGFERDTVSRFRLSALKKKEGRRWQQCSALHNGTKIFILYFKKV